ncbi:carboxypeptidase-like regulatory domain-containing protein [Arenibacter algicola]|uniref:carboxypeptidase-like regulatory domain-containing protein n=1 Tax=Arenibacter algicola TaxID=616991 RepID=UPI001C07CE8B|nr:carboxypeptidase-like regulatory domain-containing protein [Arenibacter algicola]MBU2904073.1 carboxypeptidase-like regulatory domain-containing protein [Arenibacter algicola]
MKKTNSFLQHQIYWTIILVLFVFVLGIQYGYSQNTKIFGFIKDNTGIPSAGATIVVKGTNNGSVSYFDGNYSISIPASEIDTNPSLCKGDQNQGF